MSKKRILWLTESWSYDTDKEIVPYLKANSDYAIDWYVVSDTSITDDRCVVVIKTYRGLDPRSFSFYAKLFKKINLGNYDLVYSSFHGFPYYYAALYLLKPQKLPVIHAAHNVIPYPVWTMRLKMAVKMEFALNSHFQVFSQQNYDWFKENYPHKSIFYAPMCMKGFGDLLTNHYAVDPSKVNLLFFGNVVGNKRLDLLIDAVKGLPQNLREKVALNICGNCTKMNSDEFIRQIGDTTCIKTYFKRIPDEEIPELFTKHDFLMLPYKDVAQSGPHMIAYYYHLPVIASDIDGFKEKMKEGITGYFFKSENVESLRNVLEKIILMSETERQNLKLRLAQYAEEQFALQKVASRYINYIDSILKE